MARYYAEVRVYNYGVDYVNDVVDGNCRFDVWVEALRYAKQLNCKVKLNLFDAEYPYHDAPWCVKCQVFEQKELQTTAAVYV